MGHHAGHQAHRPSLLGIDDAAGEKEVGCSLSSDGLGEAHEARDVAAEPPSDEELAEAGLLRGDADVGHERQLHAPTYGGPVDRGHHGTSVWSSASAAGVSRGFRARPFDTRSPAATITCFTSSPEQNAGSAPVITRQRADVVRTASSSSAYVVWVRALRASGRSRVRIAMWPRSS